MKKSLRFLGMGLFQTSRFPTKECRNSTYPTYWKISKNKNNIFTFKKIATKTKYIERNSVSVSSFFFRGRSSFWQWFKHSWDQVRKEKWMNFDCFLSILNWIFKNIFNFFLIPAEWNFKKRQEKRNYKTGLRNSSFFKYRRNQMFWRNQENS